jgi:aspartokinase
VADIRRQVERFIETDPVIKKGLQRRIINSRALARYILEAKGVNSTLDTVLGIVRRYPLSGENDSRHRQVFKDCEIATRNNVADLAVENGPDIMKRIAEFASTIRSNRGESLRVTVGFRSIRVIADEKALESFRQKLLPKEIISYSNDLAEISLLFPPEAKSTKGIIAKISTELALNDVNLVGIICNSPEDILLITEADAPRALQVLQRMLGEEAMNASIKRATSRVVLPN